MNTKNASAAAKIIAGILLIGIVLCLPAIAAERFHFGQWLRQIIQ